MVVARPSTGDLSRTLQAFPQPEKNNQKKKFRLTIDQAFADVVNACSKPRKYANGTWISPEIQEAYLRLHQLGHAHSVESWLDNQLVGGIYGVAIGRIFFGESMFHFTTDASKVAFAYLLGNLLQWNYHLIDCQVYTPHLASLGAEEISRTRFNKLLHRYCNQQPAATAWKTA